MSLPPPSRQTRTTILHQFRTAYLLINGLLASLTIAAIAWHWSQPTQYYKGFSYSQTVPILLVAIALINGISFYFQDRYVRRLLQRPNIAREFQMFNFALRFYLYNLIPAIVLSVVGFMPLLALLFFFWIYPIVAWLVPYHLISGFVLGWQIKQRLSQLARNESSRD